MQNYAWMLAVMGMLALPAEAGTFRWDRNADEVDHYEIYACKSSPTCVPGAEPYDRFGGDVPQTAVGVTPSMPIPPNTLGRAAVVAVDAAGNKSAISNIVTFPVPVVQVPPVVTGPRAPTRGRKYWEDLWKQYRCSRFGTC